jgi:hypothetical protein
MNDGVVGKLKEDEVKKIDKNNERDQRVEKCHESRRAAMIKHRDSEKATGILARC